MIYSRAESIQGRLQDIIPDKYDSLEKIKNYCTGKTTNLTSNFDEEGFSYQAASSEKPVKAACKLDCSYNGANKTLGQLISESSSGRGGASSRSPIRRARGFPGAQ